MQVFVGRGAIQGFEFDYVGVIIGPDLVYNFDNQTWIALREKSADSVVKRSGEKLVDLLKNTYRVLLTRGMKGCYVYFVDKETEKFFKSRIETHKKEDKVYIPIKSPYAGLMINVPLYESVGCGELMIANTIPEEMIPVRADYMSKGSKYFVLRTKGDSMNKAGINDGDLVLCVKNYQPSEGSKVVALIGDDATIKEYHRENGGVVLKPQSDNPKHKPLKFINDEGVSVQGVVVKVLEDL